MRKLFKLFCMLHLNFVITLAQSGWILLNQGTTETYNSIQFISENTGWICGYTFDRKILKSTNGGLNWIRYSYGSAEPLNSHHFIDENTGWACGYSSYSIIIKSTDGGVTWVKKLDSTYGALLAIRFVNSMTGFTVGRMANTAAILKTTDGGENWVTNLFPLSNFRTLFFINQYTGWCAGEYNYTVKTTNCGLSWIYYSNLPNTTISSIFFVNENTGWATSFIGDLFKSTNGGINWIQTFYYSSYFRNIFFVSEQTGWIVGGTNAGVILKTSNSGENWILQPNPAFSTLYSVSFINNNTGWISGFYSIILKTTNGGLTGLSKINNNVPYNFSLYQNYPNPFNPATKIKFALPLSPQGEGLGVRVIIFDILGREVTTLVNEQLKAGTYETEWDATNYPSGVYYYKLIAGDFSDTKKMVVIK